jgi:uncharacterized protein (DUF1501 family)
VIETSDPSTLSRRRFLGSAACAGISAAPLLSTLLNLSLTGRAAADSLPASADYRAVVCLFLNGGNDSFNMLVPRSGPAYADYKTSRQGLALPAEQLLPLGAAGPNHPELGLHPAMPELKSLFDKGHAAFVANVGSLVRPLTLGEFRKQIALPTGLFSHSDQQGQWMTALPDRHNDTGWAGRASDLLREKNIGTKVSMSISLAGNNLFQYGRTVFPYSITPNGSVGLDSLDPKHYPAPLESLAVRSLLEQQYKSLFEQSYMHTTADAVTAHEAFSAAVGPVTLKTVFPDTPTGRDLHMVARAIGGRDALGLRRQTFFVQRGGWDHHADVLANQQQMLPEISQAIAAFMAAMEELHVADQVTLFTASDFGRTLTSNGRGSDHAWGGNHFIVGGAVKGGAIYGKYPPLALKTDLDTGQGRLIPTMSVDTYMAELACWLGVPRGKLTTVFPNLGTFFSATSTASPVGFMRAQNV